MAKYKPGTTLSKGDFSGYWELKEYADLTRALGDLKKLA